MSKKLKKRIFFVAIPVLLIVVGFGLKIKLEVGKLSPIETKEIIKDVFSIQDSLVNFFVIKNGGKYIIIDCGNDIKAVSKELNKIKVNPDDVTAVLLTHTDRDHVAALSLFKKAKVFMSRQEEQMINGKKSKFLVFGNRIDYNLLEDRQVIHVGDTKIQGILAPGHTAGSMCFLVNDQFLFTGDTVSLKDGGIGRFNEIFDMDADMALKSVEIVKSIPNVKYIITSHYGYSKNF